MKNGAQRMRLSQGLKLPWPVGEKAPRIVRGSGSGWGSHLNPYSGHKVQAVAGGVNF